MAAPPFILLAKRILSISANSASCERLFSVFGNTLTKLRSRLGTSTLTNLAELKMFIRDQHRQGETKGRLKRVFKARTEVPNASEVQLVDPTGSTDTFPPNAADMETPAERARIVANETIQAQARQASNNFRSIVDLHTQLAAEDDLQALRGDRSSSASFLTSPGLTGLPCMPSHPSAALMRNWSSTSCWIWMQ